ncbi:MAG: DUF3021 domain-containing protein [Ruminococcus sp.]|nr:DUF3021 domain-containing protein [Ruminococcus sp.]
MKKFVFEFMHRGLLASVGGPIVLAIVYGILSLNGVVDTLSVAEVVKGILTSALLAFVAGGITAVYNIDKLQAAPATLIHCFVLYLDYILIYLLNGWIEYSVQVIVIFTSIFFAGFALIWTIIYLSTKKQIKNLNSNLSK